MITIIEKIIDRIKHPIKFYDLLFRYWGRLLPDKLYLQLICKRKLGYKIDLKHPKTFNEKLQWLKLYGHKPQYVTMADKYLVKQYVSNLVGDYYVVPLLGVWDNIKDIDIQRLPNEFVLKCNHNSGGVFVCKDKEHFNFTRCFKSIQRAMKSGYYYEGRDKQYRDIKAKIIADTLLDDNREGELQDYKFWCFDGVPTVMYITNKGKVIYENFYDMEFNPVDIHHGSPRRVPEYEKPKEFEEMKDLAVKLSKGMPFVRIDFYDVDGHVYFGEYTFFDWGGLKAFDKYETDLRLGKYIKLPIKFYENINSSR